MITPIDYSCLLTEANFLNTRTKYFDLLYEITPICETFSFFQKQMRIMVMSEKYFRWNYTLSNFHACFSFFKQMIFQSLTKLILSWPTLGKWKRAEICSPGNTQRILEIVSGTQRNTRKCLRRPNTGRNIVPTNENTHRRPRASEALKLLWPFGTVRNLPAVFYKTFKWTIRKHSYGI